MYKRGVTKLAWYSHALMILTTIHHTYGAVIYDTPWRLHVLFISIPVLLATFTLQRLLVNADTERRGLVFWLFILLAALPSMILIGMAEGLYNHALKNILFFTDANTATLYRLFPPPTYEMPNDLVFEVSGVMQGLIVIPMMKQLFRLFDLRGKNAL